MGKVLFVQTDNLSRTLQDSECTAIEGQDVALKTIQTIRNDKSFEEFWKLARSEQARLEVEGQSLPRKRRRPRVIDNYFAPTNTTYNPEAIEEMNGRFILTNLTGHCIKACNRFY